ncbi:hypothetical protein SAMN05421858_5105 [Haladaptatus litoreus]|uniref:Uncharacterized protein n=1 Tax=Haladaptatus litoreus TaxID=553468 RepID=A0A1N7FIT4_9EURY|nr:hypothetical protein SAMN05421858_5105 [Haladaptatus litoreus]
MHGDKKTAECGKTGKRACVASPNGATLTLSDEGLEQFLQNHNIVRSSGDV